MVAVRAAAAGQAGPRSILLRNYSPLSGFLPPRGRGSYLMRTTSQTGRADRSAGSGPDAPQNVPPGQTASTVRWPRGTKQGGAFPGSGTKRMQAGERKSNLPSFSSADDCDHHFSCHVQPLARSLLQPGGLLRFAGRPVGKELQGASRCCERARGKEGINAPPCGVVCP